MPGVDWIPGLSQLKATVQLITGDVDGAGRTTENFLRECPGVSQVTSVVQLATGDAEGALETQKRCVGTLNNVANGIPVVGHVKGAVHHIVGDHEGGNQALNAATRSTVVIGSGAIAGLATGGLGAIPAGIAAGGAYDITATVITDEPQGFVAAVGNVVENPSAGAIFDAAVIPVGDALAGYSGGQAATKVATNIKLSRLETKGAGGGGVKMTSGQAISMLEEIKGKTSEVIVIKKGAGGEAVRGGGMTPGQAISMLKEIKGKTVEVNAIKQGTPQFWTDPKTGPVITDLPSKIVPVPVSGYANGSEERGEKYKQRESKQQESKQRENNQKESKQQESKQQESKQQESKQQECKQQESKQQESKQQESKQRESKQQESKQQESKQRESKQQESKQQESKQQESKQQESKQRESKQQESKQQESKQEEGKQDDNEEEEEEEPDDNKRKEDEESSHKESTEEESEEEEEEEEEDEVEVIETEEIEEIEDIMKRNGRNRRNRRNRRNNPSTEIRSYLYVRYPSAMDETGEVLIDNTFQGLLHTFVRHSDQWLNYIPNLEYPLEMVPESVLQTLRNHFEIIRSAGYMQDARNAQNDLDTFRASQDLEISTVIEAALYDVQMKLYKFIKENIVDERYMGEWINEKGNRLLYFEVKDTCGEKKVMVVCLSHKLRAPNVWFTDNRPVRAIITIYFISYEEALERLSKIQGSKINNPKKLWLYVCFPSVLDEAGEVLMSNTFQGLLHTFIHHSDQWLNYIPNLECPLEMVPESVLETLRYHFGLDRFMESQDLEISNYIEEALYDIQMELYKFMKENIVDEQYLGEETEENGDRQLYFEVKDKYGKKQAMVVCLSRQPSAPNSRGPDNRPIRQITKIYFVSYEEALERIIKKPGEEN